jgi:phosphate transport system substrate-binding protein
VKSLAVLGFAAAVLTGVSIVPVHAQDVIGNTGVTGAGSTFAYPVISKWAQGYQRWLANGGDFPSPNAGLDTPPPGVAVDYESVGSLAGTMRVKQAAVDFGASDVPMISAELGKLGLAQFPLVIGGVVAVVNIDGVAPGAMRFDGPVLADIFLGRIDNWSDPAIKALNPDLKLPDAKIAVIRRSDGSGTTFNFTDYLSRQSPQWREKVGSDLLVSWPVGTGAKGNEGVSQAVKQTTNSIGYVEFSYALQLKLSYATIRNRAGEWIKPDQKSFQAAAASAQWEKTEDFSLMLTDAPGKDAYPMAATVFVLISKSAPWRRTRDTLNFVGWALDKGGADASALGYVPLPESLVKQVKGYWSRALKFGA